MDNWSNWFFLIVAWVLSIPTAIIINLATPSIDTYLKNRSLSFRERQIKAILIRYINIKNMREYPAVRFKASHSSLNKLMWLNFISPIITLGLFIVINILLPDKSLVRDVLEFIASFPVYYVTIFAAIDMSNWFSIRFFDSFKKRTIKKLRKLGCNPKDYGIE